jgi:dolichol-phosphate mannosyltransferase
LLSSSTAPMALLVATGLSRVVSSGFNFTINKKFVFLIGGSTRLQLIKYYLLCTMQMLCSWLILYGLSSLINKHLVLLKIITDTFLFMISFIIQRLFIFKRSIHFEKET